MDRAYQATTSATPYIGNLHILYVEDEEAIRSSLARILLRRTGNLTLAENGLDGLNKFYKEKPDLIITDIRMPEMGGLEMIAKIRETDPDIPIIITTGHNDETFFMESINLGVDKYIKKPVDTKDLLAAIMKIAAHIEYQKELQYENDFINSLLDINPACLALYNHEGLYYINASFKKFLGVNSVEEFRSRHQGLYSLICDTDCKLADDRDMVNWAVDNSSSQQDNCVVHLQSPQAHHLQSFLLSATRVPSTREAHLLIFTDITQLEKEKQYFQFLAEYDSLTRIYNRNKITKEMDKEITRVLRYRQRLSGLMIDVDHFKKVNDSYGHQIGDKVLVELANLIQSKIRKTDVLGRYGGEEFILLMPSTPLEGGAEIAERLRQAVETFEFTHAGRITCSIGVTEYNAGESSSAFIKRMDDALYSAKNNGRNRVETLPF